MANTIILKKSSTANAVPAASSLQPGELAVNLADAKLYSKTVGGTVILVGSGAAGGTVTSVNASGGTTGLSFLGGPITGSGTLTLSGTLGVANGGTGVATLTSGYLLKGNGASAVSSSVIYDNGTNVSIGGSILGSKKLSVISGTAAEPVLALQSTAANGYSGVHFYSAAGAVVGHVGYGNPSAANYANAVYFGSVTSLPAKITTNDIVRVTVDQNGNVGIGADPTGRLSVRGGVAQVQCYNNTPASPTEAFDWPYPALEVSGYGDFSQQTMFALSLPNDGGYYPGFSVWNFKLNQTANSTTSSGVNSLSFAGPGQLQLGAYSTANTFSIGTGANAGLLTSPATYSYGAATYNYVVVTSAGDIRSVSSSQEFKKDIENLDSDLVDRAVANLRPVYYRVNYDSPYMTRGDEPEEWSWIGLIAEEVAAAEPRLATFKTVDMREEEVPVQTEQGIVFQKTMVRHELDQPVPHGVDYARLSVLLLEKVQRMSAQIAALEARIFG